MSRINYDESMDDGALALQMGREVQTIRGKRSRAFLRELEGYLLEMHPKRLIEGQLCDDEGEVCALGLPLRERMVRLEGMSYAEAAAMIRTKFGDWDEAEYGVTAEVTAELGISKTLGWLVVEANDDEGMWPHRTPEERWKYVLRQVRKMLEGKPPVDRLP